MTLLTLWITEPCFTSAWEFGKEWKTEEGCFFPLCCRILNHQVSFQAHLSLGNNCALWRIKPCCLEHVNKIGPIIAPIWKVQDKLGYAVVTKTKKTQWPKTSKVWFIVHATWPSWVSWRLCSALSSCWEPGWQKNFYLEYYWSLWQMKRQTMVNYALALKTFPENYPLDLKTFPVQSLLFNSLAKTNHMTIPNIKTKKKNEKHLQIALMITLEIFSVSSYLGSLILWWQTCVGSAYVYPCNPAEKTQEISHILAFLHSPQ